MGDNKNNKMVRHLPLNLSLNRGEIRFITSDLSLSKLFLIYNNSPCIIVHPAHPSWRAKIFFSYSTKINLKRIDPRGRGRGKGLN